MVSVNWPGHTWSLYFGGKGQACERASDASAWSFRTPDGSLRVSARPLRLTQVRPTISAPLASCRVVMRGKVIIRPWITGHSSVRLPFRSRGSARQGPLRSARPSWQLPHCRWVRNGALARARSPDKPPGDNWRRRAGAHCQ